MGKPVPGARFPHQFVSVLIFSRKDERHVNPDRDLLTAAADPLPHPAPNVSRLLLVGLLRRRRSG